MDKVTMYYKNLYTKYLLFFCKFKYTSILEIFQKKKKNDRITVINF